MLCLQTLKIYIHTNPQPYLSMNRHWQTFILGLYEPGQFLQFGDKDYTKHDHSLQNIQSPVLTITTGAHILLECKLLLVLLRVSIPICVWSAGAV